MTGAGAKESPQTVLFVATLRTLVRSHDITQARPKRPQGPIHSFCEPATMQVIPANLPEPVARVLSEFVDTASTRLGAVLRSVVLYGSAAEGELRPTSDVNAIVVLTAFDSTKVDALRDPLRTAYAAIRLHPMFILEHEIAAAIDAFAVKFADLLHRRVVLFGTDPFAGLKPSREAELRRLKQVLLNITLRLRQKYLLHSLRDEQTATLVAESAGPLRSCAAALLELEGETVASPKEALKQVVHELHGNAWQSLPRHISQAREERTLPPGVGPESLLQLIELASDMRARAEKLQ